MRAEKSLIFLLRCCAIMLIMALALVFFPHSWMASINRDLGWGDLPNTARLVYLTRSVAALYAIHGVLVMYISLDVRRYLPLIFCFSIVGMIFGAFMAVLDICIGMPRMWTIGEGPFIILICVMIFGLATSVKRHIAKG
jgi:hypothetical protein